MNINTSQFSIFPVKIYKFTNISERLRIFSVCC